MWPPDRTARRRGLPNSHLSSCRGVKTYVNPSYTANSGALVSEDEQALSTAHRCAFLVGKRGSNGSRAVKAKLGRLITPLTGFGL